METRLVSTNSGHSGRVRYTQVLEATFRQIVAQLNPDLVVEVGAHEGSFSRWAKGSFPNVPVIAFEANPVVFKKYKKRLITAGVDYRNVAITSDAGAIKLKVPMRSDNEEALRMGSVLDLKDRKHVEYTVDALRLDDSVFVESERSVAWIDVEGAARSVLDGGEKFFEGCRAAYLEVEARERWAGQGTFDTVREKLADFGLVPVLRDVQRRDWQFNALFLRQSDLRIPSIEDAITRHFQIIFA